MIPPLDADSLKLEDKRNAEARVLSRAQGSLKSLGFFQVWGAGARLQFC